MVRILLPQYNGKYIVKNSCYASGYISSKYLFDIQPWLESRTDSPDMIIRHFKGNIGREHYAFLFSPSSFAISVAISIIYIVVERVGILYMK